ncbi:unnamed protein product [Lymnaea stagnalis]|uniref:DUF4773 domain-containing protein n=1 Tax=Lymnaea stagnalis TaxID=6523 RepID=A0AAV2H8P0_LYMST
MICGSQLETNMHTFFLMTTVFCLCIGRSNSFDLMKILRNVKESVYEKAIKVKQVVVEELKEFGAFVKEHSVKAEKEVVKDLGKFGEIVKENTIEAEKEIAKDLKIVGKTLKDNTIKAVNEVVEDIRKVEEVFEDWRFNKNCSCQHYMCGCSVHLEIPQISLNNTGCLSVTYLADEVGFEFLFTLDGNVIFDRKLSVKNPPALCTGGPFVHHLARICFRFHDLDYKEMQFTGCASLEAELESVLVKTLKLGCFGIPTLFLL